MKRRQRSDKIEKIQSEREYYKSKYDEQQKTIEKLKNEITTSEKASVRATSQRSDISQEFDYWHTRVDDPYSGSDTKLQDIVGV